LKLKKDLSEEKYSKAGFLKKREIPIRYHKHEGLMHNKFAVIDDNIVITGSFNWTASADKRNDEKTEDHGCDSCGDDQVVLTEELYAIPRCAGCGKSLNQSKKQ